MLPSEELLYGAASGSITIAGAEEELLPAVDCPDVAMRFADGSWITGGTDVTEGDEIETDDEDVVDEFDIDEAFHKN